MKREEIFQYVKEQYGTEPEYLWKKDPDSAVLRHKNGKWYAIIMVVEKKILGLEEDGNIDILDVKCVSEAKTLDFLDMSYDLIDSGK